jgi:hypothetical protein
MQYLDFIKDATNQIEDYYQKNQQITNYLKPIKYKLMNNEKLVNPVEIKEFNGKIGGVDSGFVSKRLSFLDILLIKTSGVVFEYEKSILKKAKYIEQELFPSALLLKSGLENDEEEQSKSIERIKREINKSIKIILEEKPTYLFIDGSIIPQYQNKPRPESKIKEDYESIIDLFQNFYKISKENECILISTIEDSRSNRFKEILSEEIKQDQIKFATDSSILDNLLEKKERTCYFKYSKNIEKHGVLKDYKKEWSENIYAFYLRASNDDRVLRIEFISEEPSKVINEIASITYQLSSINKEYSYPSILIEADMRARLTNQEIEIIYNKLIDKIGPKIKLRRGNRPFK